MRALVTGGTGFVGRALRARLAAAGDEVIAPARQQADLADPSCDFASLVAGCDAVYHLAARVHQMHERVPDVAAYRRVNVDATLALARAAAQAGVRHFVFISSVKAAGEQSGEQPLRESDPPHPEDEYGRSKLAAEEGLRAVGGGMTVTILRPPLVYGPGVKANMFRLFRAIDRGLPLPLGRVTNRRSVVYVANLADAMRTAVAAGGTFYVSDGDDVSSAELARRIGVALGRKARLVPVPVALLRLGGTLLGKRAAIDRLTGSLTVDSSALRDATGWQPPFTMAEGLAATAEWYRSVR